MTQSATVLSLFPDDAPKEDLSAKFDEFYLAYPKRVDKALARSKFMSIVKGGFKTKTLDKDSNSYVEIELTATADQLIDAAKAYTRSLLDMNTFKRTVEDKFIPSPAVWLNKGRFED